MKSDLEMTRAIMESVAAQQQRQKRKRRVISAVGGAALAIALVVTGVHLRAAGWPRRAKGEPVPGGWQVPNASQAVQTPQDSLPQAGSQAAENETETRTPVTEPEPSADSRSVADSPTVPQREPEGGYASGGIGNYFNIPMIPQDHTIIYTGEEITDAEAQAYFAQERWLKSALSASGVPADQLRIAERGYCHVSYSGTEGEHLEVRRNFRDYLAYHGETLVAILTLTKENGQLSCTPAFGAPWFEAYAAYLSAHAGQPLVYVYAGSAELVIAPDGSAASPMGLNANAYLEGVEDPYAIFACPAATYTP